MNDDPTRDDRPDTLDDAERQRQLDTLRRRSGIRVGASGELTYAGHPIENERVVALFHAGLDVRDDGEVTLTVGRFWCFPDHDGVVRFVRALRPDATGGQAMLLSGVQVGVAGAAIGYAPDDRFYVWFDGLMGPARVLRDAHQVLAGLLADDPDAGNASIGMLSEIPRADAVRPGNLVACAGFFGRANQRMRDDA